MNFVFSIAGRISLKSRRDINRMMPHCVKSVQIRSFFWSVFSCIRTKYRFYPVNLRIQFVRIQENIEINSVFRHFTQYQYFEREIVFVFVLSGFSSTSIHDSQGSKGRGKSSILVPLYHFHPLHRHLDISRAITAGSTPLRVAGSGARTGNLWFPSSSR